MILEILMPKLSPTMTEGQIASILVKEGDFVKEEQAILEIATDKSTMEYASIEKGYVRKIYVKEGDSIEVGKLMMVFTESPDEDISSLEKKKVPDENITKAFETIEEKVEKKVESKISTYKLPTFIPAPPKLDYQFRKLEEKLKASPLAKKVACEKGLDLRSVKGSGPQGRIILKDLEFAQKESAISLHEEKPKVAPGTYEEIPMTPIRKVIAERLQASKMTIPHYYVHDEVRVDAMMKIRDQLKQMDIKLTFNDFILKAAALSLRKHPEINSGFNSENQTIIRFKSVDISLAVSIPDGLITPILFHSDYKSIMELSEESKRVAKKAKEGSLKPDEYQGGSFTISNLGMFGIESFDAVINPPQAAILAVGGIFEKVISENGHFVSAHTMKLTLSIDHRVIDGAEAAKFLGTLKQLLLNPACLLL
jgi:pyruvate dehydrogenase E2 component (dihydrolipoamide acetyltransferase)